MQVEVGGRVAGDAVASWRLPVRAGSQVAGMVGISTTSLADYNVEVAQFVAAGDPVLVPHFSGLAFTGRALALASGAVGLDLDARLNHRRGLPKMIQMGGPMMTRMEKASFDVLRVDERVVVDQSLSSAMRVLGEAGGLAKIEVSVR